jgi:flagellar biosynthesis protein FlhB
MSDDFWYGVFAGVVGLALLGFVATWFRNRLSEFLNPTKKQKVGHSTEKTPSQVVTTSFWAAIQIIIGLAVIAFIIYVIVNST